MTEELAFKCHQARLTALLNEAYYRRRAQTWRRVDRGLRFFVVAMSAGAVAATLRLLEESYGVPVLQAMAALAALASVAGLMFRFDQSARELADLASRWSGLVGEFDRMAVQRLTDEEREAFALDLLFRSTNLHGQDTSPRNDRLAERLYKEICVQEGLPVT